MTPRYRLRPLAKPGWTDRWAGVRKTVGELAVLVLWIGLIVFAVLFFSTWTGQ